MPDKIEFNPLPPPDPWDFAAFYDYLKETVCAGVGLPAEVFDELEWPEEQAFAE